MGEKILVTGGAGFIGSYIVDLLVEKGHEVTIYDNLEPQVHGPAGVVPAYVNKAARFIRGNILDGESFSKALEGQDVLFHEAAMVGVGQSMYEIARYTEVNAVGAAKVLEAAIARKGSLRKMMVASSMSIYGEGRYNCPQHGSIAPRLRSRDQLSRDEWEMRCPACGQSCTPLPTDEEKPLYPTSIYAVNKRDHEEMFLAVGRAYGIPTVALRYFNVFGPRQALSNPYTGAAAIFSCRLLNGNAPVIYEDGLQMRDFVHVTDIARANVLAMEKPGADYEVLNVGTGRGLSILDVARQLSAHLTDGRVEPGVVNKFREGDIRHCFADISKARRILGYEPRLSFEQGIGELVEWVRCQTVKDEFDKARQELKSRGLTPV